MPYSVSSWFIDQAHTENPAIKRTLTIGTSDYSGFVLKWPTISRQWDDLRPVSVTIDLSNEGQTFNFFRNDKTTLRSTVEVKIGFTRWGGAYNVGGPDSIAVTPTSGGALDVATNSDYSFEANFSPTSASLVNTGGFFWCRTSSGREVGLEFRSDRRFSFAVVNSAGALSRATDPTSRTLGQEYHVVGVRSRTSNYLALYVGGTLVDSVALNSANWLAPATNAFAACAAFSARAAYGVVDESRFYATALTNSEALDHSQGRYLTSAESLLLIHLGLDEVGSSTIVNSGLGSGTTSIVNSPVFVEKSFDRKRGPGRDEMISAFYGTSEKVVFDQGKAMLTVADKLKLFSERVVGVSNSPVIFSSSILLGSDIAWTLCTCYGGLSSVQSTSNPDINYTSWLNWAAVFSADTVLMRGRFDGQKVTECLRKLADMTQSAIVLSDNKITFNRFTTVNTNISSLDDRHILNLSVSIDDADMVNKQWVYADYRPESQYHSISCFDTRTASVNSFGLREGIAQDESVWYVTSANAINLAQRIMSTAGVPYDRIKVETPLVPVHHLIGETVVMMDSLVGVTEGWRIMGYRLDTDAGRISLDVDGSQVNTPFILDVSSLDGTDILL